ncbi:ABC transporter ATP-binding protein [Thalassotalea euphylliae]|uniref:ABC transporter ATP-binding protein n=1 Tax=Thalassotalea euphylliae TaxID=1655234 RepID=UPI0036301DF3
MFVQLKHLQFSYSKGDDSPVLAIDEWQVEPNERVFLHGPSGTGKSTLLNILSGMRVPTSGEVIIDGEHLEKLSGRKRDKFRAENIGYVFQQFNLIAYLDAIDNIRLASHFSKKSSDSNVIKRSHELLDKLNISDADRVKPVSSLSIGQQQRIAIARALINRPKLLIADEPTSSLDANNRERFISILLSLCEDSKTTVIFVSHDMSLSQYFDRTVELSAINLVGERA